jgi:pimeloyl-ACP methyl ester carboxylesterase
MAEPNIAEHRRVTVAYADVSIDVMLDDPATPCVDALVLLPSSSRDSEDFDDISERFAAAGLHVLRPQPRGMCGTTGPLEGLTLHDYARDVAEVIRQLVGHPAYVLGHAFGQCIARCLATNHPDLTRGVVLAAAAARSPDPALREALAKCADTTLPAAVRLSALQTAFFAPGHDPSVWLNNWHPLASKSQRAAADETPIEDWWTAGSAPVLDLQAEHDPWRPPATRSGIVNDLGSDRVSTVVIPDASHALIAEQPEAVVRAVLQWISGLED